MSISRRPLFLLVSALLATASLPAYSEEPKLEEGWISLFNGKDLTGWKISDAGEWKVEDGTIVTAPKVSHLFTEKEFKNFEFKADVKTAPGSNSGIYFHTKFESGFPNAGYECQVNCTHRDPVKNCSLYNVVKVYDPNAKDDEWYTIKITVKGKNIVTRINDKIIVDYTEPEGVTGPRKLSEGSMALQSHDPKSVVHYKNIMIKPLP